MPSITHYRMLGNAASLAVHLYTYQDMMVRISRQQDDEEVQDFNARQYQYITIWTFAFQLIYLALGLTTDVMAQLIGERKSIVQQLQKIREFLFSALVFSSSMVVVTIFWPFFFYDHLLVCPPFMDKMISPANNIVLHLFIAPVVLWELATLPREAPKSHKTNMTWLMCYANFYFVVIFTSYYFTGVWPYPVLYKMQGTIWFYLYFLSLIVLATFYYYLQWPLTRFCHQKKTAKKNC
ncbi:androgen-dependent TFPI-regulating protein-like [Pectinophora gossypiella]|uniref:Androgen-dependent TFPI-regulating protein n=1 Tax=Pectinophora gossypiella TaxID=13191 RepID=A0A1E1W9D6_PECGO|nr:androgen-dependent TFPI-regulating protein-like [Pectinophora gossypiella]